MKGKKKGKLHTSRRLRHKEKINRPGATGYIARSQVTKRLQLSIAQFRQLCIYKGVHPVEPGLKRIRKNVSKTWYYLKDINFMKRDDVMTWFRDIKTYKKRAQYLKDAKRPAELAALKERKPKINMDHFVRERYPTLQDAVNDLDDALSLISLFVEMQYGITAKIMQKKQFAECIRLKSEWMAYVADTHALRKVFVSIKGIYYQADVLGSTTTWLAPHPQRIKVPISVDVVTMCFFVNFYITMLNFVLYRLYTDMGYQYPPKIDAKLMSLEENVKAVKLEKIAPKAVILKTESAPIAPVAHPAPLTAIDRERIAIVNSKLAHIIAVDVEQSTLNADEVLPAVEVKEEPKEEEGEEIPEEFRKIDEEAGENKEQYLRTSVLFSGLKFLINREIPKIEIRFMLRAFGGEDFTEYDVDEKDNRITHQIVDREWDKSKMLLNREYVQPQWIFDSINAGILLPYHEYAPDAVLPPHISPFINDALKGYVPKQRDHINELIEQQKKEGGEKTDEEGGVEKEEPDSEDDKYVGEGEDDDDGTTIEAKYAQELAAEQEGKTYAGYVQDELGQTDMYPSDDGSDDSDVDKALKKKKKTKKEIIAEKQKEDEEDRERMSIDLLNAKTRRIVRSIKGRLERSKSSNEALEEKRRVIEKKQKKEARAARHILPQEPAPVTTTTTTTTTTTIPTPVPGAGTKRKQERALNSKNFAKKVKK